MTLEHCASISIHSSALVLLCFNVLEGNERIYHKLTLDKCIWHRKRFTCQICFFLFCSSCLLNGLKDCVEITAAVPVYYRCSIAHSKFKSSGDDSICIAYAAHIIYIYIFLLLYMRGIKFMNNDPAILAECKAKANKTKKMTRNIKTARNKKNSPFHSVVVCLRLFFIRVQPDRI